MRTISGTLPDSQKPAASTRREVFQTFPRICLFMPATRSKLGKQRHRAYRFLIDRSVFVTFLFHIATFGKRALEAPLHQNGQAEGIPY